MTDGNYIKILQQFSLLNLNQNSTFTISNLKQKLLALCSLNGASGSFDDQVYQQLVGQCKKNSDGTITLKKFIKVIVLAQSILQDNIKTATKKLTSDNLDETMRTDISQNLLQFKSDYQMLTTPFKLSPIIDQQIKESKLNQTTTKNQYIEWIFLLSILFYSGELILNSQKHYIYRSLLYFNIFLLGFLLYFCRNYLTKFIFPSVCFSALFDAFWLFTSSSSPTFPIASSNLHLTWYPLFYLHLFEKIILIMLLFRSIENTYKIDAKDLDSKDKAHLN